VLEIEVVVAEGGGEGEKVLEAVGKLGFEVLVLFHFGEVVVDTGEDGVKLVLVGLLVCVKFDYPALEHLEEIEEKAVVVLLLLPGGEP
jgi:hypothetical protein